MLRVLEQGHAGAAMLMNWYCACGSLAEWYIHALFGAPSSKEADLQVFCEEQTDCCLINALLME